MLCVFHVSSSMVYYSTRNVTLNGVSSGKANFGFAPNAFDSLGCAHYVMSVYDVQRDCFKMQSSDHLITLMFCFEICLLGVLFFSCSVLSSLLYLPWLCFGLLFFFFQTFSRSSKPSNESWESLNLKSGPVIAHGGSQVVSWSFSAENADFGVTCSNEQVDFNRLCWNETTDRCSEDYVDSFPLSHV